MDILISGQEIIKERLSNLESSNSNDTTSINLEIIKVRFKSNVV